MNTYEILSTEQRMLIASIETFILLLVGCFFVGFMFGFLIAL